MQNAHPLGKSRSIWIFVEDTARIIADLMEKAKWGEVYNIPGMQRVKDFL